MQDGLWQAVLGEIELSVSRGHFVTWFKNTRLLRSQDDVLVIGVQNVFVKQQMERRFNQLIADTLRKNGLAPARIIYKVDTSVARRKQPADEITILKNPRQHVVTTQKGNSKHSTLAHNYRQGLNAKYTFENFIVGSGNELAYAACQAVTQNPGTKYNPLFLYGGSGIGKTHLVQAVGNSIVNHNPDARVVYISIEQFVQEFLDAIRFKKNTDFQGYYRGADVLIVDDMQFITGKEKHKRSSSIRLMPYIRLISR